MACALGHGKGWWSEEKMMGERIALSATGNG
jgi:hypothetical protein